MIVFNVQSPQHISLLLFGGFISIKEVMPLLDCDDNTPLIYLSGKNKGQIRTHKMETVKEIKGLGLHPLKEWETKKKGIYSTNEETLKFIELYKPLKDCQKYQDAKELCSILLKIREIKKQLQTYYEGTKELIYDIDSCIHPQFCHVATDTSRLSCSKPNIQNIPTDYSLIKQHFTSRYDSNGCIACADYSQLEIRIQAQLCKDENYIKDIVNKVDFHCKRVALKEKRSYEKIVEEVASGNSDTIEARSKAKSFSFARAYGAGLQKISKQTGLTQEEVKTLIENEDNSYPKLKLWNDWNISKVNMTGSYIDPWGRIYKFKKYPAPDWMKRQGIKENYMPTDIKNYQVQGFATGNVVPIMLGRFWREKVLFNRDKYLLINTVHDSVMLDCRKEFLEIAKKDLLLLENVGKLSKEQFNYEFKVPITIDIKDGNSWFDC